MSNTLDRLKALNSKLEAKLSQKKGEALPKQEEEIPSGNSGPSGQISGTQAGAQRVLSEKSDRESTRRKAPLRTVSSPVSEKESDDSQGDVRRLTQILLHHLKINAREEPIRAQNLARLADLYLKLDIGKKAPDICDLFIYKAMNISGIGLKEEDFGEIREGKYVQVIAITYEPDKNGKKKAKNISLGYFGKAETLDPVKKNRVIEFVLRWRYEKAFQNLEHYRLLLEKVRPQDTLF
jgi:hypothetical protein